MSDPDKPSSLPAFMTGFSIAVSGALVTIATWGLKQFAGVDPPPEVTQSCSFLIAATVGYISHRLNIN